MSPFVVAETQLRSLVGVENLVTASHFGAGGQDYGHIQRCIVSVRMPDNVTPPVDSARGS